MLQNKIKLCCIKLRQCCKRKLNFIDFSFDLNYAGKATKIKLAVQHYKNEQMYQLTIDYESNKFH